MKPDDYELAKVLRQMNVYRRAMGDQSVSYTEWVERFRGTPRSWNLAFEEQYVQDAVVERAEQQAEKPRTGKLEKPRTYLDEGKLGLGQHLKVDTTLGESVRASVLREAEALIDGDRNAAYGPPTQDFQRTANLLEALGYERVLGNGKRVRIEPSDVAIIIACVKLSRLMHSRGKRDSWTDIAGYAACGYECTTEESTDGNR